MVVHRDLKPGNVLLGAVHYDTVDPAVARKRAAFTGLAKIADFGLSKTLVNCPGPKKPDVPLAGMSKDDAIGLSKHGAEGYIISQTFNLTGETGSYRYMAPEVFKHETYNHKVLFRSSCLHYRKCEKQGKAGQNGALLLQCQKTCTVVPVLVARTLLLCLPCLGLHLSQAPSSS